MWDRVTGSNMSLEMQAFHWNEDFENARVFLVEAFQADRPYMNWIPTQLENVAFGPCGAEYLDEEDEYIRLWLADDRIAAFTMVKPSGECWVNVHPDHTTHVKELVEAAEQQLLQMKTGGEERPKLEVFVADPSKELESVLVKRGYSLAGLEGYIRERAVYSPAPAYTVPEGFIVRNANIEEEFEEYRRVLGSVFGHCANMTRSLARRYSTASFYNAELDIVAVAPDGHFGAFCTVRVDPSSKITELEPVGTHPNYRRMGLAKAVICEGLKRLKKHSPTNVCIPGAAPTAAADRLYESLGFTNTGRINIWQRAL
ncbi:GNAT family N-acetyltransferase [Candidatus Thorarchaeota archaeon]|nr:MAG: GNAT family N-acetyltransferase [Candidatus Thorarchaeota archaeon]